MADTWWPMRSSALATERRCTDAPFTPPSGIPRSEHSSAMRTRGLLGSRRREAAGLAEQASKRERGAALIEKGFRAAAGGCTHAGAAAGRGHHGGERIGERLGIAGGDDAAGHPVAHDL